MTETVKKYLVQAVAVVATAAVAIASYALIDNKVRRGGFTNFFKTSVATETVPAADAEE
ncbi:MAG: hypothetical protein IJI84_03615 [Clostridia bacterium]|nr:hypothetical protein [Clostridia bacterium]